MLFFELNILSVYTALTNFKHLLVVYSNTSDCNSHHNKVVADLV